MSRTPAICLTVFIDRINDFEMRNSNLGKINMIKGQKLYGPLQNIFSVTIKYYFYPQKPTF